MYNLYEEGAVYTSSMCNLYVRIIHHIYIYIYTFLYIYIYIYIYIFRQAAIIMITVVIISSKTSAAKIVYTSRLARVILAQGPC